MNSVLFEIDHNTRRDYPYIDYHVQNINFLAHFHEEIEIVVVTDGAVDIVCDNYCYTAKKDDICVFMPTQIHSFSSSQPNRLHIFKMYCKHSLKKTDFTSMRFEGNTLKKGSLLNREIRALTDKIVEESIMQKIGFEYMINSIMQNILSLLLRSDKLFKIDSESKNRQFFYLNLLNNVNVYIGEHYSEAITLKDICSHCNLSEYYFAHVFKLATNSTFVNYLTAYRLEKSLPLLLHSDKKIIDIALECGFFNTRSFNRAFQKFFSMTPSEYKIQRSCSKIQLAKRKK